MVALHSPATEGDKKLHTEVSSLVKMCLSMLNDGDETISMVGETWSYNKQHTCTCILILELDVRESSNMYVHVHVYAHVWS